MKKIGETKVSEEQAEKEFYQWLETIGFEESDFRADEALEDMAGSRNRIIKAICNGMVIIDNDDIIQKLYFPLKTESGSVHTEELHYKCSIKAGDINRALRGLDPKKDWAQMAIKVAGMLTSKNAQLLDKLDARKDYKIMQAIVGFFQS